jgi:Ni,Fe-hydrogenase III large subunit/Ni,Fe-hydrogenase III component G
MIPPRIAPELQPLVEEITRRFAGRISLLQAPRRNEVYFEAGMELVAGFCAQLHRTWSARLVSVFADDARAQAGVFHLYYVLAIDAAHGFFILRVPVSPEAAEFPSLTNAIPAVNWQEREIQDWFGLKLIGHPNPRRCALHDDWPEVYPLRKDFDLRTVLPPFAGARHKFRTVEGEGVFQVPVGPVHAGIIEPGHFLFSVAGEPVLYLQLRLFYVHKGTEKLFEHLPFAHAVRLAESVSGDSSFAHATAFCHALERAAGAEVPARARALRTVALELERVYNHTADIGAIATDVGFVVANAHALRLRENVLRINETLSGSRLLRGLARPGGVRADWSRDQLDALRGWRSAFGPDFDDLVALIHQSSSTRDRLETTGILTPTTARDLGVVGLAGRASGVDRDLRRDFPHAFYDQLQFHVPVYSEGDVLRRMQVRIDEVGESLGMIEQVLDQLPNGPVCAPIRHLPDNECALGYVEGWRGEIFYWLRTGTNDRLQRCRIKDPSLQNWPALAETVPGNIIPDFPVINKSFNLSYSGTDR